MSGDLWIDASSGASGDMLLGALLGAGVPVEVLQTALDAVSPEPVTLRVESVRRAGFAATRCHVQVADSVRHRTWSDVRALLAAASLADPVRDRAMRAFGLLAEAEGTVHGHAPERVHFHEVGALDAIADIVGVCAGVEHLAPGRVTVSPVAVGSGSVQSQHGTLPVPPPAVAELLRGVPSYAGPSSAPAVELCTPTGAALLRALATDWGPQPPLVTDRIGIGAGGRDPDDHANVLRLLVGSPRPEPTAGTELVVETNVDDLDPRVWPSVLAALLAAGAVDAWLTPILMKKGRPAHTLHALVPQQAADAVRREIFRHTSTLGVRERSVTKHALGRELRTVQVAGQSVQVKVGWLDDDVVTAQPEHDDLVRAATALGWPVRRVLAEVRAAIHSAGWTR